MKKIIFISLGVLVLVILVAFFVRGRKIQNEVAANTVVKPAGTAGIKPSTGINYTAGMCPEGKIAVPTASGQFICGDKVVPLVSQTTTKPRN